MSSNKYLIAGLLGGAGDAAAEIGGSRMKEAADTRKLEAENAYREGIARLENQFANERQQTQNDFTVGQQKNQNEFALGQETNRREWAMGREDLASDRAVALQTQSDSAAERRLKMDLDGGKYKDKATDYRGEYLKTIRADVASLDKQLEMDAISPEDYRAERKRLNAERNSIMYGEPKAADKPKERTREETIAYGVAHGDTAENAGAAYDKAMAGRAKPASGDPAQPAAAQAAEAGPAKPVVPAKPAPEEEPAAPPREEDKGPGLGSAVADAGRSAVLSLDRAQSAEYQRANAAFRKEHKMNLSDASDSVKETWFEKAYPNQTNDGLKNLIFPDDSGPGLLAGLKETGKDSAEFGAAGLKYAAKPLIWAASVGIEGAQMQEQATKIRDIENKVRQEYKKETGKSLLNPADPKQVAAFSKYLELYLQAHPADDKIWNGQGE